MEIIHLILGKANPERMNGVNRVVNEMATVQTENDYKVQVWGITANTVHDYPPRIFTTKLFLAYKNPFKLDRKLKGAFLRKRGKIVVHIHGAFLPVFYSASQFLHRNHIPFIITPHSSYNLVMMKKNALVKKIYFAVLEKNLLNRAARVHLLGKTEWDGLAKMYNNNKSLMIPYGFSRPAATDTPAMQYDVFTIGYCGRISIQSKGLDIMLKGFAVFHNEFPQSQMVIIGDGNEMPVLKTMAAQLGIASAVIFKGSVFGDEKLTLLRQCHVFAHPSRTDGIPATIVESAAIGLPCVVSKETNTGDFIKKYDAGYCMQHLDAVNFYLGLKEMYDRIIIRHEGELLKANAFRMIDEAFNWKIILEKFAEVYSEALSEKNRIHSIEKPVSKILSA